MRSCSSSDGHGTVDVLQKSCPLHIRQCRQKGIVCSNVHEYWFCAVDQKDLGVTNTSEDGAESQHGVGMAESATLHSISHELDEAVSDLQPGKRRCSYISESDIILLVSSELLSGGGMLCAKALNVNAKHSLAILPMTLTSFCCETVRPRLKSTISRSLSRAREGFWYFL